MSAFFLIVGFIGATIAACLLQAWVLVVLWSWFVTPLFPAAGALGVASAFGLLLVVDAFMGTRGIRTDGDKSAYVVQLVAPLVLLGVGWIAQKFI